MQHRWKTKTPEVGVLTDQEKAARDDRRVTQTLRHTVLSGGVKGLAVINSAGVAAMLGFFQSISSNPRVLTNFKPFGIYALAFFLGGAILAAAVFAPYAMYIQERNKTGRHTLLVMSVSLGLLAGSCAIVGALLILAGIHHAF